jgi:hypothetical protein
MGVGPRGENGGETSSTCWGINRFEALGHRHRITALFKGQCAVCPEKKFYGATKSRPEFDLAGDGALGNFASQSRIENKPFR